MKPLVSILIPAYNSRRWIAECIHSALAQTWPNKEIIVINDGSTDGTENAIKRFGSRVKLISTENHGLSAAANAAYRQCSGDYIQELDSDDILAPDKIERQLAALRPSDSKRIMLSSPWARFYYRTNRARFVNTSLCQDLSPVEWLLRKMGEDLHMQNATWLVSRELAEIGGPWNESLCYDQDGEYFDRLVTISDGIRFVPGTGIYYRSAGVSSVSWIGSSDAKKESLMTSIKVHLQCLQSLEKSERVRRACLTYLQKYYEAFYPERLDLAQSMRIMAAEFQGSLQEPRLRWKYNWMKPIFGLRAAKYAQNVLPQIRCGAVRQCERAVHWALDSQ